MVLGNLCRDRDSRDEILPRPANLQHPVSMTLLHPVPNHAVTGDEERNVNGNGKPRKDSEGEVVPRSGLEPETN